MSENTDIPGIDGIVSALTGEDPGTFFWLFHKFNARSMEILLKDWFLLTFSTQHLDKKFKSDLWILLHQKNKKLVKKFVKTLAYDFSKISLQVRQLQPQLLKVSVEADLNSKAKAQAVAAFLVQSKVS